ncbi:DUF4345 domain-containing protein [Vibrio bivalvicida]|uniref:DUF4345 domain-containing protein n=1 Tax=Vibrio bivalvicida TaxID=1276888 RepID=A0ABV4MI96_9VIBR
MTLHPKAFLLFCATGLVPIALSYGFNPALSLEWLYSIQVESINLIHIMRAVMGLYLAMVTIWIAGSFVKKLTVPALVSCAVFMLGLAFGRVLSFVIDGMPHWLLVVYAILEFVLGAVALLLVRQQDA